MFQIKVVLNFGAFCYDQKFNYLNSAEDGGFTTNPNFILFKWRLKRKHLRLKFAERRSAFTAISWICS